MSDVAQVMMWVQWADHVNQCEQPLVNALCAVRRGHYGVQDAGLRGDIR